MPPARVTPFEFCDEIYHQKTRIVRLPDGEEMMTLAFVRFDTIPARDGETDGRTDGHVAIAKTRASSLVRLSQK